jgi:hypothetical protein
MMGWLTEPRRKAIYGVLAPLMALLIGYGILDEAQAALWSALVVAVAGFVMAFVNTNRPYGKHSAEGE